MSSASATADGTNADELCPHAHNLFPTAPKLGACITATRPQLLPRSVFLSVGSPASLKDREETMMKRTVLGIALIGLMGAGSLMAQDRDWRYDRDWRRDNYQNRDLRRDYADRRYDRQDIRRDEAAIDHDRWELRRDLRNGNYAAAERERAEIRGRYRDMNRDRVDLRHDNRGIYRDRYWGWR